MLCKRTSEAFRAGKQTNDTVDAIEILALTAFEISIDLVNNLLLFGWCSGKRLHLAVDADDTRLLQVNYAAVLPLAELGHDLVACDFSGCLVDIDEGPFRPAVRRSLNGVACCRAVIWIPMQTQELIR